MTTKNSKTGTKAKKAVAAPTKVSSGAKRAVKRARVQMVKPTPSSPMPAPVFDAPAPSVHLANGAVKSTASEMKSSDVNVASFALKPSAVNGAASVNGAGHLSGAMKSSTVNGAANGSGALKAESERRIERSDFELIVRRTAYRLAQRRQFRGGSPAQDWFAAEAAVTADLQARGISLPN